MLLAPIHDPCHCSMQRLDSHPCKRRAVHVAVPDLVGEELKSSKGLEREALTFDLAEVRDNVDSVYGEAEFTFLRQFPSDSEVNACNVVYLFYQLPLLQRGGGQAGGSVLGAIVDSRMSKT